ncbi:hypothetical protein A2841_03485 [Candidatus Kaiserbacteria bacterium RIFCSPHIGHO2_01_FULL_48_10]|uniref:VTT domain-containing protein n=1 Tax=Candidatus Kaiserbacteria bacterium RIFCSPHIGHO2_01_FULL_48_10 TaxID=1798476 RepID=A0A1F6C2C2_9BACT|nr:MAG: hypothetical protein A2841_03485 [Candidatus Kaiserbacteria bacterium RIFCSPHIGHO2_01_FULL_48_10]
MSPQKVWHAAQFPLFCLSVVLVLYAAWFLFDLPPKDELIEIVKEYLARYGYPLVFVGSFLEALLLIGWYFPGSLIIFLSVILASSPFSAAVSVFFVTLGLYSGYGVNFLLGKYGWYRLLLAFGIRRQLDEAQIKLSKYGIRAIFASYWNPGLASFISTAAGILQYPVKKFLIFSLIAVSLWDIFWGTLVYSMGERALYTFLSLPFVFVAVVIWILVRYFGQVERATSSE